MASTLHEFKLPDGSTKKLGNIAPPGNKLKGTWKVYGDYPQTPMIKREDWKPVDLRTFLPPVKDQDGIGSCNAFSTIYCSEGCRAVQGHAFGTPTYAKLSPGFLYGLINGGSDDGSMLEDAIKTMTDVGTCLATTVGELDWKHRPQAAYDEAKKFRFLEAYWCPTFGHMASACQSGFFVSSGLMWYDNYNTDGDGWLPFRPRGNAGGHAVARCGLAINKDGKTWGLPGPNSWTEEYGAKGYMTIPEQLYNEAIGGFWALRQMVDEGQVVPLPPSDVLIERSV